MKWRYSNIPLYYVIKKIPYSASNIEINGYTFGSLTSTLQAPYIMRGSATGPSFTMLDGTIDPSLYSKIRITVKYALIGSPSGSLDILVSAIPANKQKLIQMVYSGTSIPSTTASPNYQYVTFEKESMFKANGEYLANTL